MFFRFVGGRRKAVDLDNLFRGSCFLVGGGLWQHGSKEREIIEKLTHPNIMTMAMNDTATLFTPRLWVGADKPDHYSPSILANPSIMKFSYIFRSKLPAVDRQMSGLQNMFFMTGLTIDKYPASKFFMRGREHVWWKTVFPLAVQILYRLGFSRVYTVGCGFNIDKKKQYSYETKLTAKQVDYNKRTYNFTVDLVRQFMEFAPEVNFELISCTPDSKLNDVVPYREFDEAWAEEVARVPEHNTVNSRHPLSEPDERKLPPFPGRISHGHRMMYDSPVVAMSNTPSSVIDIGCGDGYGYHTLVSQGAVSEYFGMDVNPLAIENGRKLLVSDKHRMEQGDWLAYPEDKLKPADFTFCIEVIEHVPAENRKAFIEKLARFTKKNLFLSTPPADRSKHGEMTVPECLALLKSAGLDAVAVDVQWTTLYICSKPSAVPAIAAPTPVEIPKTTMLVGAYQRDEQLDLTLASIARQSVKDLEVLVLNDGLESPTTEQVARKYGFTYVFTGQRNAGRSEPLWRIPGFAFNIGAKMAKGDVLVLTCAELYHVDNDCLEKLITPLVGDSMRVCVANGKDDDMSYLRALKNGGPTDELFSRLKPLRNELPFLMALYKSTYLVLGGYDEDFVGRCYDDDDFTDRLKRSGHKIIQTDARAVHLWHRRLSVPTDGDGDRVMLNKRLFFERRGQIQRNTGREWGVLK